MSIQDVTKAMALDETLQSTNTALGLLAKDATVSAISTALALLGKDTSIQAVVTALGLLNKDATMVTQNSKLDTIITKLQGIIEALGVDTSIYKAAGNKACADLTSSLLVAGNLGNVYNITDNGTTTADFVEGTGKPIHLGDNVAVVDIGEGGSHVYKFDLLSGLVDLSNYIQKSETAGLIKNDGTIDTTPYTVVEASETNGNIVIDDVEMPVYRNYGNNTVLQTDKTPFLTRQTLNPTGFSGYVREKLIGASYAWNQLVDKTKLAASSSSNGITMTNNGDGSLSFTGTGNGSQPNFIITTDTASYIPNHVYLMCGCPSGGSDSTFFLIDTDNYAVDYGNGVFVKPTSVHTFTSALRIRFGSTYAISGTLKFWVQLIDLTLAFGSTIADYLYGLSNNGGITKLREMGFPIDQYTAYGNYLVSSKTSAKKVVGFNTCDEVWESGAIDNNTGQDSVDANNIRTKNYIPCLPNTQYYLRTSSNKYNWIHFYDADKKWISGQSMSQGGGLITSPSNAHYFRTRTTGNYGSVYQNDICFNISDTNKNGTYEPYSCTTYSLGSTELRGHLIVSNGEIVAEGDVRESNGGITRPYKEIDLGSLNYYYDNTNQRFTATITDIKTSTGRSLQLVCAKYTSLFNGETFDANWDKVIYDVSGGIFIHDHAYTDPTTFKTAVTGLKLVYPLATPTTEQSTPFADPMSLVGATTEEYIDTRDIPCPVGAERQYMGQSEDIIPIPSAPQSDGVWVQKCYVSGGKAQYVWELET